MRLIGAAELQDPVGARERRADRRLLAYEARPRQLLGEEVIGFWVNLQGQPRDVETALALRHSRGESVGAGCPSGPGTFIPTTALIAVVLASAADQWSICRGISISCTSTPSWR